MENEEQIVVLRTYYDPMLAHIIRTRLEESGIPCTVDDNMMSVYPVYSNAAGGIKLRVFQRDVEKAEAILAEDAELPVEPVTDEDTAVICPYCGSNNVRSKLAVAKDANWLTRTMDSLFKSIPLGDDPEWHCFNCGRDFDAP
jgi:hypothetical protein